MRQRIGITIALSILFFGGLFFPLGEVKGGDGNCCTAVNGMGRSGKLWCKIYGDYTRYNEKPSICPGDNPVPEVPEDGITFTPWPSSGTISRGPRPGKGGPENHTRQTASAILSLLILGIGLGGLVLSFFRLLRPGFALPPRNGRGATRWFYPMPRAAGFAGLVAVIAIGSCVWLSTRGTQASKARSARALAGTRSGTQEVNATSDPQFNSAIQIGGTGITQVGGTAVDKQGDIYVAGGFFGKITFNTTPQPTTLTSTEAFDVFVAKYDPAGKPLWARMANGATGLSFTDPDTHQTEEFSFDGALSVAVDAQGAAYVGGGFVKSLSFKDAAGNTVAALHDDAESGEDQINFEPFVAKYDATGTLKWARGGQSGAPNDAEAEQDLDSGISGITEVVVDKAGNPYVAGTFSGTSFIGHSVTAEGKRDILLSRLDSTTGDPVWVSTPGSTETDAVMGLAIDDSANLYLIGDMGGTITFPTQPDPTTLTLADTFGDSFVAKYNQAGQALWAKQIGGDQPLEGTHIAVSGAGELYLTGNFEGEADFDSIKVTDPSAGNGRSGYLAKYTTDGNALWVRVFGRNGGEASSDSDVAGYRVAVDSAGAPFVSGIFQEEATFGRETPSAARTLQSDRTEDQFVAHYDAAGNFQWVKRPVEGGDDSFFTFYSDDTPVDILPTRLVYNNSARALLLIGDFRGTLALDALNLNSGSARDAYVATLPDSSIQLSAAADSVSEGAGAANITVTRSGDSSAAASVDYSTADASGLNECGQITGLASSRCDYATTSGTLHFAAGETTKTISIPIVDDAFVEGTETFSLALSNISGATQGSLISATVSITDNDSAAGANPITQTAFFVRQQYIDFLGREPDPTGFQGWQEILNRCVAGDTSCDRIAVSSGFFRSPEFQARGYFIFRFYAASLGRNPTYAEFIPDLAKLSGFLTPEQLEANQAAFVQEFTTRAEYVNRYASLGSTAFIDTLLQTAGLPNHPQRASWINGLDSGTLTRAQVLRALIESTEVYNKFYNQAFVVMQYFGYLRRDPDAAYLIWIQMLNQTGDYRAMISGFINSNEYVHRFGQ